MAAAMRSNFHPKYLHVDGEEALVASANFTMAAQKKNVQVGVKVKAPILVTRLRTYFLSLGANGPVPLRRLAVHHLPVMLVQHLHGVVGFSELTVTLLPARR
jgi:phosphatidylserine/phosphatidylglycerophosphate/cardiolipin synthase-like enzyme